MALTSYLIQVTYCYEFPKVKALELGNFIHSFIQAISIAHLQVHYYSEALPMDTVPEFYAEAPQATVSEGLGQGLYAAARAGVEPMTLRTKGVYSTKVPPTPRNLPLFIHSLRRLLIAPLQAYDVFLSGGA